MNGRRFPPPWSIEEQEACFVVPDPQRYVLIRIIAYAIAGLEDLPGITFRLSV